MRFAYRLALRLGISDVSGWLGSLPARSLDTWWTYYHLEPWDLPREHWPDVKKKRKRRVKMVNADQGLAHLLQTWGM